MTSFWEEQPSPAFYAGAPFHDIPMSEACPDSLEAAVRAWREQKKAPELQGLIVIRYYLALRGAENGVTAMVTPFFCVQG